MSDTLPPPRAPRASLRDHLRRAWERLRGGELTPERAAWSVALGLFIGTQPLPGLHLPIVVTLCVPLRLDAVVAYAAANISIPPIAPLLWLGAVQLGACLLHGRPLPLSMAGARMLMNAGPGPLLGALVLGALALGTSLAVLGGVLTYVFARARVERGALRVHDPLEEAIVRTAMRFAHAASKRGSYYYVRGKLRSDPSTRAVASRAPLGHVLDLGCGRGQLAILLLESGAAASLHGVDWDARKVALAARAAVGLTASFEVGDVRKAVERALSADTVLLIDVLHYFDRATQDALLERVAAALRPGGLLLVREADRARGWRSWLTRVQESVGTALRFNRGERVLFRDVTRELVPLLEARGIQCIVEPCWGSTPLSNVLLVARRPAGGQAPG